MKKGILLLQMGGPCCSEDIENFLFNLFSDPQIIQLPWFLKPVQKQLARSISSKRSKKILRNYDKIGGRSPILFETQCQAKALEKKLQGKYKCYIAMRYSYPRIEDCLPEIKLLDELTVIPLYPQYSSATSGSSIAECKKVFEANNLNISVRYIKSWYDNPYFVELLSQRIKDAMQNLDKPYILFSAHGLPLQYIKNGDPYQSQIEDNVYLLTQKLGLSQTDYCISYQSRVGPSKWLKPYTDETIKQLGVRGIKNLIIVPISFVGDHIETLEEIGMQYRELAKHNGIINFRVTRLAKANPLLISALANLVTNENSNLQSSRDHIAISSR
jgi:protoporphyrin/coproporphyrin ferrochelatase